ncbi:MAG: hypothetical protein AAF242_13440, partial [Bacteroidota bacterium]
PIQLQEINGDGKADLVGFGRNGVEIALSTGSSFSKTNWNGGSTYSHFGPADGYSTANNLRLAGDVDGNGMNDIVGFGNSAIQVGLNPGPAPDLMSSTTDGLGNKYSIEYTTLSDRNVYTYDASLTGDRIPGQSQTTVPLPPNTNSYPVFHPVRLRGGPLTVVSSYTKSNDASINNQTYSYEYDYTYKNAAFDTDGRGWLGYAQVSQTDKDLGFVAEVDYYQEFPFTGKEMQVTNYCYSGSQDGKCSANAITGRQRFTYYCQPGSSCTGSDATLYQPHTNVYQVLMEDHLTDKYDYGVYKFSLKESKAYDQYGNVTTDAYYGYVNSSGTDGSASDNVFTYSTYFTDTGKNVLGKLKSKLVTNNSSAGSLSSVSCASSPTFAAKDLSLQTNTYDNNYNLSSSCVWDNGNSQWNNTQKGYDQFGNETSKTYPGGQVVTKTIESTYNTYLDHETTPANSGGTTFTTYYGWDPRTGRQVGQKDQNGNTTLNIYNDFGYQVAIQGPYSAMGTASTNMTSSYVVGSGNFASASVTTLSTQQVVASGATIYINEQVLQNWGTGTNLGFKTKWNYLDGLNRKYKVVEKNRGCEDDDIVSAVGFNSDDKFLTKTLPHYSNASATATITTTYDAYQRPTQITTPVGPTAGSSSVTTIDYLFSSNSLKVFRKVAAYSYTPFEQDNEYKFYNEQQVLIKSTIKADNNALTSFTYDPMGRVLTATSPPSASSRSGLTDETTYFSTGQTATTSNSSLGTESYKYNANGKLVQLTTPKGQTNFSYDNLQRVRSKQYPDGSKVRLHYDSSSVTNALGHLTNISSYLADGSLDYVEDLAYDNMYNISQSNITVYAVNGADHSFQNSYSYDPLGRRTVAVTPDNAQINYNYTSCNLGNITSGGTTYAAFYNY